jgi:hypothetical protein
MLSVPVHVHHSYASCEQSPYVATFCVVPTRSKWVPTHRRSLGTQRSPNPTIILCTLFLLPHTSLGVWEKSFGQIATLVHWFTRPISPTCGQYIQYLLVDTNLSVLNRHRHGLQHWRCQLSTSHSPPFPTNGPRFLLRAPPGLRLKISTIASSNLS